MKKKYLALFLCFFASFLLAQSNSSNQPKISSSIKVAYNSASIYPGIRLGFELPTQIIYKRKTKKNNQKKQIKKSQFLTFNIGYYHQADYHDNLYFTVGYTFRRVEQKGFFTEFSPEIGYSRTFLGGTTYQITDAGQVGIKHSAGYNHLLFSLGVGFGYDFSKLLSKPYALFYKANLMVILPYNNSVHLRPAMELGIIFTPAKLLPRHIKTIIK